MAGPVQPPVCRGCVFGLWIEHPYTEEPPVVIDALDDVSIQLELGHDGGREVDPGGMQLRKGNRLGTGLA
jgi:hypothetical protein